MSKTCFHGTAVLWMLCPNAGSKQLCLNAGSKQACLGF